MNRKKKAVAAVCGVLAALLLLGTTAYAAMYRKEKNERGRIAYIEDEEKRYYPTLESAAESEGLAILLPEELPEGIEVSALRKREEGEQVNYRLELMPIEAGYSFSVYEEETPREAGDGKMVEYSGVRFEIQQIEEIYWAGGWHEGYWYVVQAPTLEELLFLIEHLS